MIEDIKNNGFDASKSLIPVGMNNNVVDGSHWLSAADKLRSIGNIVYSQDVYLTYQGLRNLMTQLYEQHAWRGSIDDHFDGVRGKVDSCYMEGKPIRTYLFEAADLDFLTDYIFEEEIVLMGIITSVNYHITAYLLLICFMTRRIIFILKA